MLHISAFICSLLRNVHIRVHATVGAVCPWITSHTRVPVCVLKERSSKVVFYIYSSEKNDRDETIAFLLLKSSNQG